MPNRPKLVQDKVSLLIFRAGASQAGDLNWLQASRLIFRGGVRRP